MQQRNIIDAILSIISKHSLSIGTSNNTSNRLHSMGEPLEDYIKDAFAGTIGVNKNDKLKPYNETFSYGGGANNPPDAILNKGDAIEVKKVESIGDIQLNSSYPKAKLYNDDSRISTACKKCENGTWTVKDIIYAIGCVKKGTNNLSSLALVYGDLYCADKDCYECIFNKVKDSINKADLPLEDTNELGHINSVDPLGITYFRARSMWGIRHPFKVFDYIYQYDSRRKSGFEMMAIIPKSKFEGFVNKNLLEEEAKVNNNLFITDCQVKDPNNTVQLIDVKFITYKI